MQLFSVIKIIGIMTFVGKCMETDHRVKQTSQTQKSKYHMQNLDLNLYMYIDMHMCL